MSELSRIQEEILRRFQRPQDQTRPRRVDVGALPQPIDAPKGGQPLPHLVDAPTGGVALAGRSVFAPPAPQPGDQILTPTNAAAITRPRSVFAPPPAQPVEGQPTFNGKPILAEQLGGEPFGTRDRRTQPRDYVADDTAYLRDQNAQPRNWKDKSVDVLRALNQVWGNNPKAFTPTKRERQIGETEDRIGMGVGIDQKRAQTAASQAQAAAAQGRPAIQQAAQDEREINNALSQYNRLESYDPDDPADAGLKTYFEGRKLNLPKKLKGSNQVLIWRNGRAELVDKVGAEIRPTMIGGQIAPGDVGRTPNAQGLTPVQAATAANAVTNEAGRNARQEKQITAANTRAANVQSGANARAAKRNSGRTPNGEPNAKANRLVRAYNQARTTEMNYNATRSDVADDKRPLDPAAKAQLQSQRENLWQEIMDTYPGMFEADEQFRLKPKAGGQPSKATSKNAVTISEREIREAGGTDADIADAKRRASKGEIKLVP